MYIEDIIWRDDVIEKLERKHHISPEEKAENGYIQGEDIYYAYGRTDGGRYVFVVFLYKRNRETLIVSARDMDRKERNLYAKK
ncbi:hypothetical protein U14_01282 [Candidatus Moduliflexus flocculans]|uniref:BrnT family toxin n=1 Tax=Candidatus Moduliflexus flocculans TaxID=1499966 RepID=A0A0S6VWD8_9BACT|nr:hypothetical protein U14_01282 [Candidatus Moduliflexus flocculans]